MRIFVGEIAPQVLSFVKRSRMDYLRKYCGAHDVLLLPSLTTLSYLSEEESLFTEIIA